MSGLPAASAGADRVFPALTSEQIARIAAHGRKRATQTGDVLYEPGDTPVPFFVVTSGELQIVRLWAGSETLVATLGPQQFTGEVNSLSGRPAILRLRVSQP
ncbi:MAG TPA: cyclic nucleotide-binding domain-containing protein, partial [Candidatus Eremiobacteraceae bacterium]|nr:cyclic nucleotide-binding domain-containing protein [Candidatus Eremiobacteraceae bacterium]